MKTLDDVMAVAKKIGATVEWTESATMVDAPVGFTWRCDDGLHCLVHGHNPRYGQKPHYEDILERMEFGLEKCEAKDCEICEENLPTERKEDAQD